MQLKFSSQNMEYLPLIMEDIFHFVAKPYKLRNDSTLQRKRDSTVCSSTLIMIHKNMGTHTKLHKNIKPLPEF